SAAPASSGTVTTAHRLGILAATVVVLILAFVLLRPGSDNGGSTSSSGSTAQPAVKTVHIVGGKPQGGIQTVSFVKGQQIRLRVVSDVADEIHVHGYNLKKDVPKGGSVEFSSPATIEGVFEVELE